jgi:LasA protease
MCRQRLLALCLIAILTACTRPAPTGGPPAPPYSWTRGTPTLQASAPSLPATTAEPTQGGTPIPTISYTIYLPTSRPPGAPERTPTPDAPHAVPTLPATPPEYIVQPGDSLGVIAQRYGIRPEAIARANDLSDMNTLEVGQVLQIPLGQLEGGPSDFKIIPDSELIYGPYSITLDIEQFIAGQDGYLASYTGDVDDELQTGAQIVQRVAQGYSVNPRLLLALLENRSGWLTHRNVDPASLDYPLGYGDPLKAGLYKQLAWAANQLNRGFYGWQVNAFPQWSLPDGTLAAASPLINPGTAGAQYFFAQTDSLQDWERDTGPDGLFATYSRLFGDPFDHAIEPLLPPGLAQPPLRLPFETGASWSFTGGPHGGWDSGSAWAALDFAPPGDSLGCIISAAWATAVADGLILRSSNGAVIQDLDGDGQEQTGWTILYMHMAAEGRVPAGAYVHAGERIGHPSCEGGWSTASHLHLARRYHGEWIAADGSLPFSLGGWTSSGSGLEYDGTLTRNGVTIPSWDGNIPENQVVGGN